MGRAGTRKTDGLLDGRLGQTGFGGLVLQEITWTFPPSVLSLSGPQKGAWYYGYKKERGKDARWKLVCVHYSTVWYNPCSWSLVTLRRRKEYIKYIKYKKKERNKRSPMWIAAVCRRGRVAVHLLSSSCCGTHSNLSRSVDRLISLVAHRREKCYDKTGGGVSRPEFDRSGLNVTFSACQVCSWSWQELVDETGVRWPRRSRMYCLIWA
jgi:hypothetical protein